MDDLTEKHGAFNRDWVTKALAIDDGTTPDEAVTQWKEAVKAAADEMLTEHNNAPNVLGGKSTVPMEATDVTKLSDKDTRNLVTKMLIAARNET